MYPGSSQVMPGMGLSVATRNATAASPYGPRDLSPFLTLQILTYG
jgi:hypothetical protein